MRRLARIPRSLPAHHRKPNLRRAATHLAFVRQLPCLACGASPPSQAAHVRSSGDGGVGIKPGDKYSLPLCVSCHINDQHRIGEAAFYARLGIDPLDVSCRLWTVSGNLDAGQTVIFKARQRIALHKRGM